MVRMVNKVVEGQKIVSSNQFLDYERPKMIQGKFLGARQGGIQEVGVQWTGQYYSGGERVRYMHICTHTYDVQTQISRIANSSDIERRMYVMTMYVCVHVFIFNYVCTSSFFCMNLPISAMCIPCMFVQLLMA